jgi:hypothetical protein
MQTDELIIRSWHSSVVRERNTIVIPPGSDELLGERTTCRQYYKKALTRAGTSLASSDAIGCFSLFPNMVPVVHPPHHPKHSSRTCSLMFPLPPPSPSPHHLISCIGVLFSSIEQQKCGTNLITCFLLSLALLLHRMCNQSRPWFPFKCRRARV